VPAVPKLAVEMIPSTTFEVNVRAVLPPDVWRKLSRFRSDRVARFCEICAAKAERNLDLHERWAFDEAATVQRLVGLISICSDCHACIHFGRTELRGDPARALAHLCRVNGWDEPIALAHIRDAYRLHAERSKIDWKVDIFYVATALAEVPLLNGVLTER
jgi:hypothetical protein